MKYRFLLVVLSYSLFIQFNFAQSYKTIFGQDTTQWSVEFCQLGQNNLVNKIAIEDTLINGLSYYKVGELQSNAIDYNLNGSIGITNGFLREDTSSGKIWFIGTSDNSNFSTIDTFELLVADLSLSLGDSFLVWQDDRDSTVFVDSVYYESGLKRVRLNYVLPTIAHTSKKVVFLEGIGTNFGFAYMHSTHNLCPCLLSYQKDILVENFQCTSINNTVKLNLQQNISIAPHPIQNTSLFLFDNPKSQLAHLNIYDVSGRIIRTYRTTGNTIKIQRKQQTGFYFYQLRVDQQHSAQGKLLFMN